MQNTNESCKDNTNTMKAMALKTVKLIKKTRKIKILCRAKQLRTSLGHFLESFEAVINKPVQKKKEFFRKYQFLLS